MRFPHPARIRSGILPLFGCALLGGCPEPPDPPQRSADAGPEAGPKVVVEPEATLEAAPAVLRLRVSVPAGGVESPERLRLFSGSLSSYHLGRIRAQALPATLLDREVPAVTWSEASGRQLVVAPSRPLVPGDTYSLASPGLGLVAVLSVASDEATPFLSRAWPPRELGHGVERAIFCGDAGAAFEAALVRFDPLALPAAIATSLGDHPSIPGCLQLRALERPPDEALLVPPLRVGGVALDPAPFHVVSLPPLASLVCAPEELPLGPSCATVEDDRLILRGLDVPTFWMLEAEALSLALPVGPNARVVVRGLVPDSVFELSVTVLDAAGRATKDRAALDTRSVQARVVINEVLADAIGPEPAQEWIELVNDGRTAVDLDRWTLEDVGGSVSLPAYRLEPGAFVLVVSEGFSGKSAWDIAPEPDTAVVAVHELGKNGLANSGEPLLLRSPEGAIASRFPGMPKPRPGVSVARTAPWALDDDPASFSLHGAPGASPGAPNAPISE
jgi:hypothetical protein